MLEARGGLVDAIMTAQLVMDAPQIAIFGRGRTRAVLHHSEQGSQYTSEDFQRLIESHDIVRSMSRRNGCFNNAAIEIFFSTLKNERLRKRHYLTKDDLRAEVFDYIESFYNPRWLSSTIGYISQYSLKI